MNFKNVPPGKSQFTLRWALAISLISIVLSSIGVVREYSRTLIPLGSSRSEIEPQVLQVIQKNPEAVLASIQAYQQKQQAEQQQNVSNQVQKLAANPALLIGDSPTLGAKSQKLVAIVFSDFQCSFCSKTNETLKKFMAQHGREVTLVYKHLPLQMHPEAKTAALAAWAADRQGKFWEFHDALFRDQAKLGEPLYAEIAKRLNLDFQRFERDRHSKAAQRAIQADINLANKIGINATPYFLLNGIPLAGAQSTDRLERALEDAKQKLSQAAR